MIYLESPSTDPCFNLALEEYAFSHLDPGEEYFMLWRNRPSVIIGKHQNAQQEVNLPYAKLHHIPVVRRLSGGGAVYHDLDNLNFTFIVQGTMPELSMERFAAPLLAACRRFGIDARVEGRNDVTVDGKKFSGNARYVENGRTMHHGTILLKTDAAVMEQVLRVAPDKIRSKGIASVRSRVTSLSACAGQAIAPETFGGVLREEVFGTDSPRTYVWTEADFGQVKALQKRRYETWEWNADRRLRHGGGRIFRAGRADQRDFPAGRFHGNGAGIGTGGAAGGMPPGTGDAGTLPYGHPAGAVYLRPYRLPSGAAFVWSFMTKRV